METKKQTAVEWLVEELEQHHIKIDIKNTVVFQQAKAMEKHQIEKAYNESWRLRDKPYLTALKYYTSTYGS
jgi:hypothetical protein